MMEFSRPSLEDASWHSVDPLRGKRSPHGSKVKGRCEGRTLVGLSFSAFQSAAYAAVSCSMVFGQAIASL